MAFQPFDFECTWWRLVQKRVVRTKFDIYVFISRWQFHQSTCFLFKINLKEKFEDTKGVTRKRKPLDRQAIQWPRKRKEQTSIYITLHRKHKPLVRQTIQWPKEKRTNKYLQNITQKTKDWATWTSLKNANCILEWHSDNPCI